MNTTPEEQEFVQMRNDLYAQAAVGVEPPTTEQPEIPEFESGRIGVCVCCGERRRIPPAMHVCKPCWLNV